MAAVPLPLPLIPCWQTVSKHDVLYLRLQFEYTTPHHNTTQVAWIKADAKAILAIHEHVITNNDRLSVTHNDFNTWTLVIRNVKMEDSGKYMCQVNTDPMKMQVSAL